MKQKEELQKFEDYLLNVYYMEYYRTISGNPHLIFLKKSGEMKVKTIDALTLGTINRIKKIPEFVAIFDLTKKSVETLILDKLTKNQFHGHLIGPLMFLKIPSMEKVQILWGQYSDELSTINKATVLFTILVINKNDIKAINELIKLQDSPDLTRYYKKRINKLIQERSITEKVDDVEKSVKSIMDSAEGSSEVFVIKEIVPKLSVLEKQVTEIKDSLGDYKDIPQQFEALESYTKESFKDLKAWRESQNVYFSDDRKEDIKDLISLTNSRVDDINTTMDRDKRTMQIWLGILTALVTILLAFVAIVLPLLLNNLSNRIEESITIIGILSQILFH